jgi:hypothetical protein
VEQCRWSSVGGAVSVEHRRLVAEARELRERSQRIRQQMMKWRGYAVN